MFSHISFRSLSLFALVPFIISAAAAPPAWAKEKPAPPPPPSPPFYVPQLLPSVQDAAEKIQFLAPQIHYGTYSGADRVMVDRNGIQMFFSESGTIQSTQYFWSWTGGYNAPVSTPYSNSATATIVYSSVTSLRYDGYVWVCMQNGNCELLTTPDIQRDHMLMDALLTLTVASGNTNVLLLDLVWNNVSAKDLKKLKLSDGRQVRLIFAGSPSESAGIKPGDILYGVGGKTIDSASGFTGIYEAAASQCLSAHHEGCTIQIQAMRDGTPITFEENVKPFFAPEAAKALQANAAALAAQPNGAPPAVGAAPASPPAPSTGPKLGIQARNVTDEDAHAAKLAETRGIFVGSVDKGGLAETMRMQMGDIILEINSTKVGGLDDLKKMLQAGAISTVTVWRAGAAVKLEVPESL